MTNSNRRWSVIGVIALCALIVLLLVLLGAFTDEAPVTETVIANEPLGALISIEGSPSAVEKRRRVRTLEGWTETSRSTSSDGSSCRIEMLLVPFPSHLFP